MLSFKENNRRDAARVNRRTKRMLVVGKKYDSWVGCGSLGIMYVVALGVF